MGLSRQTAAARSVSGNFYRCAGIFHNSMKKQRPGAAAVAAITLANQRVGRKRQFGRIKAAKIATILQNLMAGNYSALSERYAARMVYQKSIAPIALHAHEPNEVCLCKTLCET
ncbi:MAG: hypothetical protein ABI476_00870 [Oxalobacteraceae bacterium]